MITPLIFQPWKVKKMLEWDFARDGDMQTRRLLKVQPLDVIPMRVPNSWVALLQAPPDSRGEVFKCRYGIPGDRLWVREKFWSYGCWMEGVEAKNGARRSWWMSGNVEYVASNPDEPTYTPGANSPGKTMFWNTRPSIFLPRWASRITLEITGVKVERVRDISQADAIAEGIEIDVWDQAPVARKYGTKDEWFQTWSEELPNYSSFETFCQDSYLSLWEAMHGPGSLDKWVWAISYKIAEVK